MTDEEDVVEEWPEEEDRGGRSFGTTGLGALGLRCCDFVDICMDK